MNTSRDEEQPSRADLHCHSSASAVSRLGVQRALGLPECATPPLEVYELARRRGMDFVTITDHDTIDGALEIADLPGTFISEELTASFRGEPQAVHVLCLGMTPDDHDWLQSNSDDIEACAEYLDSTGIVSALAHPFYSVAAALTSRHRRRLAELFPIWETRNGSRARELNMPAAIYVETHGGIAIGGSDDHAGIDIGRTFTQAPHAASAAEFLEHVRAGRVAPAGEQGSAEKWAHAAMALAVRALGRDGERATLEAARVLEIAERVLRDGDRREGRETGDLTPADARALLRAWLDSVGLGELSEADLVAYMQRDGFTHAGLHRRATRAHERLLRDGVATAVDAAGRGEIEEIGAVLFGACIPAIPYAPSAAFIARERAKLSSREGEGQRVAIVADGIGAMHGVTRTIEEIRERGVEGFEIEVIGTDRNVDRRLAAVADVEIPHYPGMEIGVPTLPAAVEAIANGRYDLIHVCAPGPSGVAAALLARAMEIPLIGSYHTELAAYAGLRSGDPQLEMTASMVVAAFYAQCASVLSPSAAADEALAQLGIDRERVIRWDRGVDTSRFDPRLREEQLLPGEVRVLYTGRVSKEKNIDLLADAFLLAHARDPRLHLSVAGGGPELPRLRERLGEHATFLGWLEGAALARAYASADVFCFPSETDTFGQVVLEAQASGTAVVAVDSGGPRELIHDGVDGLLVPPSPEALADALISLAGSPQRRAALALDARAAVEARTWERALARLADGYRGALGIAPGEEAVRDAA
ncbi:MAG TPA: glycosyltransferase [Solirubrobacteraceae bacterium]|jgi:glycosyltransferase involved in cell wall biosynthesis/predicted metal-dependent phosphoesterase TrpH|nr:glycosyltransferase [Solirubrobacteraceae bacterium]